MIGSLIRAGLRSREGHREWGTAGEEEQPLLLLETADPLPGSAPPTAMKSIQSRNCSLNVMPKDDQGGGLALYEPQY